MLVACALSAALFGAPRPAAAATDAEEIAAGWPDPSRLQARAMIEKYGEPHRRDDLSLTWFGLFGGRRTVIHKALPGQLEIEQVVLYRVPAAKVADLTNFDPRITVKRKEAEMSARTDGLRTSLLTLNLAHEIASGFKTVPEAKEFRERQTRLAAAGKSSRYLDRLTFEEPRRSLPSPFVLPGGVNTPPPIELKP